MQQCDEAGVSATPSDRRIQERIQECVPHIEHLFGDERTFAQCHASTLVLRRDHHLLVAWFGGSREGNADVGIWAAESAHRANSSTDLEWFEPRCIAKISDIPHWNPVLFALSPDADDLVLHFKVGRSIRSWETWAQRSHDGGKTWTAASPLVPGDRGGRGAVRNKCIRLVSGNWLAGASVEGWRRWDAFIDRSPDGLDDWNASEKIKINRRNFSGKGLIQPALWESSPGRVHALFRSTDGRVHRSDSNDDGLRWSPAYPIDVPNNNSGLDLTQMNDGTLALACNPVSGNWAARSPLCVLFSTDNGETWPERVDLETDPGEFSYPAIIEIPEGLAVSYTWNRRRIAVARLTTSL
jgi:predicted neuraminidase